MLARLEVAYLGILRVVLLVAATVALLVTFGATVTALPSLAQVVGIGNNPQTRGGTLREFIDANRITDVEPSSADATDTAAKFPLPEKVSEASKAFARYDARNGGGQIEQSKWDELFRSILAEKVPFTVQDDYGEDLLRLSHQLERSSGKPLSDQRVLQLIEFHLTTFLGNVETAQTAKATGVAASMSKLLLAGGAFLIFVLVLFSFLFVKIERNLRMRHSTEQPEKWAE